MESLAHKMAGGTFSPSSSPLTGPGPANSPITSSQCLLFYRLLLRSSSIWVASTLMLALQYHLCMESDHWESHFFLHPGHLNIAMRSDVVSSQTEVGEDIGGVESTFMRVKPCPHN